MVLRLLTAVLLSARSEATIPSMMLDVQTRKPRLNSLIDMFPSELREMLLIDEGHSDSDFSH